MNFCTISLHTAHEQENYMPTIQEKLIGNLRAVLADMTKEGNKVAKTGSLPPGRNAEKDHDVASFNAGMRYAMQKFSTALKQIEKGSFQPPAPATAKATSKTAKTAKAPAKAKSVSKQTATVTPITEAKRITRRVTA